MLSVLQKDKLTHYFNLLDYDNNKVIEKSDFSAIAENLCILWHFKEGTENYVYYVKLFEKFWVEFRNLVEHKDPEVATLGEWLDFADRYIVNGPDDFFDNYIGLILEEIFDCFDNNKDGFIGLDEYIDLFMAYRIEVRYSAKSYTKLDLNSDDMLSKDEMLSAVREFFRSEDENAPGNWLFGYWEGGILK